ncbi:hypothetical protein [Vibrio ziniensis]|uniref:Uncharacterized protein n=1 Tax=Vibrio ziniensis TaxID=2711221 RepID=A0A6G7CP98_9VIBR|nr:hypothetical protein [Vibrio ziniensis]QIH43909.1 hypothetical protein G5S32_18175 [Vibrio ziniensis]
MSCLSKKSSKHFDDPDSSRTILMRINETESSFFLSNNQTIISLPVGFDLISTRYFKHTPPTYDDIEYAINYIEDEIEKVVPQIASNGFTLITDMGFIRQIAILSGLTDSSEIHFKRDDLEYIFGQYAEIAMGRHPYPHESDISPKFYAQLLIFREFMHHLKFDYVTIKSMS